jgi:hypothetical protein
MKDKKVFTFIIVFILLVFTACYNSATTSNSTASSPQSESVLPQSSSIVPSSSETSSSKPEEIELSSSSSAPSSPSPDVSASDIDAKFYPEYGFIMQPKLIPNSDDEKNSLNRLLLEIEQKEAKISLEDKHSEVGVPYLYGVLYDDFDGDGANEMFTSATLHTSTAFWFIKGEDVMLLATTPYGIVEEPTILEHKSQKFAIFKTFYDVSKTSDYMFGLRDGSPYETNISKMMIEGTNNYDEVLVIHSTMDATLDETGRTWKPYYFYMTSAGVFIEYGGKETNLESIYTLQGAKELFETYLPEDAKITTIYYRANGIININYITMNELNKRDSNQTLTLRFDGTLTFLEKEGSGVYLSALRPDMATYPAIFFN